ncbi:IS4 family transposase [Wukongibacter sp. M2B1]|uniref:IS4 family transposase n=1 Tax=Wukongibacter sp. M2B1 TaxID=3088895 RepID=UPI003D790277
MKTTLKDLANKLKEIFSEEFINEVAYKTGFSQRKSKLSPVKFLSLCTFLNEEMCTSALSELSTRLDICENLSITTEGLNQRFNDKSVSFMKYIFKEILLRQSNILSEGTMINTHFNQIRITDSSAFKLPSAFQDKYKGTGGNQTVSGIKIQLEYNLNTGQFLNMDVFDGTYNDATYLFKIQSSIDPKDLCLKDLGYFKIDDLKIIERKEAYYLSRLKTNIKVYVKNSHIETFKNGKPKKGKEYIHLNILDIISPLAQGETIEIKDVYIGNTQSLKTRLIITKLSEENKIKKLS